MGLKVAAAVAALICVVGLARADEDIADGEDGYMDRLAHSAVIEVSHSFTPFEETSLNTTFEITFML